MNNQMKYGIVPLPTPKPIDGTVSNPGPCGGDHLNPPNGVSQAQYQYNPNKIDGSVAYSEEKG